MKRVSRPPRKEAAPVRTCIECAHSSWDTSEINLTVDERKPFMLKCPFTRWVRFPKDAACDRFKQKV